LAAPAPIISLVESVTSVQETAMTTPIALVTFGVHSDLSRRVLKTFLAAVGAVRSALLE